MKIIKRLRPRSGAWILIPSLVLAFFSPFSARASAEQGDTVIFSYSPSTIYQEVSVDTSGKTELTATIRAAETQYGTDTVLVGIGLYGEGGGGIYFHDTGWVSLSSGGYSNITLSVDASSVGAGWAQVASVRLTVGGDDGEFWAGNYGPSIESASLKIDGTELLSNTEFSSGSSGWTSSVGWQNCHATQGDKPCSSVDSAPPSTTTTTTTIPINNSMYSLSDRMVWGTANEGWNLSLSAPGGGTFTEVVFASYGNPNGSNGLFTQNWCHATNSISEVSQEFLGKSTGTIGASNGIFGDPCGGTYKRLYVVLKYTGGLPNTTTTTLPTCGPYSNLVVTGKLSGSVWGSGPYTDDSDFGVAAVHAGLAQVGETVTLVASNIAYHLSYPKSTANGVTTDDWLSGWCGYDISLLTPPTTTTTTVPETTTTEEETTTTVPETTTTTEPESEPEPTVPETTTTIDSPPTGTTIEETTTTIEPEPEPEPTPTTVVEPEETAEDTIETTTTQPEEPDGAESIQDTETTVPEPAPDTENEAPQDANNEVVEVTADNLSEVLDGEVTPEVVDAVVDAIASGDIEITAEVAEQLVDVLTGGEATEEQIVAVIEALLQSGEVTAEIATELATSPEVLQAVSGDEATEIFAAVEVSELTEEVAAELIAAVQDAPEEVRESFEAEINVFGGKFDTYVPTGSNISVAERRTVVAVSVVSSVMVVSSAAAGPSAPSPSSGGGGGSSGGGPASTEPSDSGKPKRRRGGR